MIGTRVSRMRLALVVAGSSLLALTACSSGSSTNGSSTRTVSAETVSPTSSSETVSTPGSSSATSPEVSLTPTASASTSSNDVAPTGSFTLGVTSYFLSHLMPGNSGGSNVNNALFTPLTQLDVSSGKVVNAVADSIQTKDQKVWAIKLKTGWTFHNGDPVTAQSFADSWNATANPKNAMTSNLEMAVLGGYAEMNPGAGKPAATTLSGVKVVDPHTLQVTLAKPNALFPALLSSSSFAPIPSEASKNFAAFDQNPIGNGPFMVTGGGMKPGAQQVVFQRYPSYAGDKAKVASITLKSYQDPSAIYTDFQAGTLDLALVDGNDLASAKADFPDQVVPVAYPAVVSVNFPTWDSRFSDVRVRQAFSMAIDRPSIVDALLKGNGTAAKGLAPSVLPGGGQSSCKACMFDAGKAKQLLADAGGFSGPLKIYTYSDPTMQSVIDAIANQWRTNLGIDATSEAQPIDQLYKNFAAKSIKGAFVVYAGTNVPHLFGLVSAIYTKEGALNVTGYSSPAVTALLDKAQASLSSDQFTSLVQEASKTALGDLRSAPLYQPTGGLLHTTKLSGVQPELLGGANLAKISVTG